MYKDTTCLHTISKLVELSNVERERVTTFTALSCVAIPTHGTNTKVLAQG